VGQREFRGEQLANRRPGQPLKISVDAIRAEVLEADRSSASGQDPLAQSDQERLRSLVALYK
jgi:multidrug resistance efflux pump